MNEREGRAPSVGAKHVEIHDVIYVNSDSRRLPMKKKLRDGPQTNIVHNIIVWYGTIPSYNGFLHSIRSINSSSSKVILGIGRGFRVEEKENACWQATADLTLGHPPKKKLVDSSQPSFRPAWAATNRRTSSSSCVRRALVSRKAVLRSFSTRDCSCSDSVARVCLL